MMDYLQKFAPYAAPLVFILQCIMLLLSKTYAKKDELNATNAALALLKQEMQQMPTREQVTQLQLELEQTRGEMREVRAELKPVNHISQLLLEQQLNDHK